MINFHLAHGFIEIFYLLLKTLYFVISSSEIFHSLGEVPILLLKFYSTLRLTINKVLHVQSISQILGRKIVRFLCVVEL